MALAGSECSAGLLTSAPCPSPGLHVPPYPAWFWLYELLLMHLTTSLKLFLR